MANPNKKIVQLPPTAAQSLLSIDYGLRFAEDEIADYKTRSGVNGTLRKFRAITAIARIMQTNDIEIGLGDSEHVSDNSLVGGLYDALIELSQDGHHQAEELGLRLSDIAKGGK